MVTPFLPFGARMHPPQPSFGLPGDQESSAPIAGVATCKRSAKRAVAIELSCVRYNVTVEVGAGKMDRPTVEELGDWATWGTLQDAESGRVHAAIPRPRCRR